jgi:hypothetical protein
MVKLTLLLAIHRTDFHTNQVTARVENTFHHFPLFAGQPLVEVVLVRRKRRFDVYLGVAGSDVRDLNEMIDRSA